LPQGDVARGKALADKSACTVCHQADYAGAGFYPNITPDALGIGNWTDTQVDTALRRGLASDGSSFCALMERFPFSDQEAADVIVYLRSLPPVPKPSGGACPGHGPKPM
jgi:mono/diheme cytochrome c family protein